MPTKPWNFRDGRKTLQRRNRFFNMPGKQLPERVDQIESAVMTGVKLHFPGFGYYKT